MACTQAPQHEHRLTSLPSGGRRIVDFVAAWDTLAPRLAPAGAAPSRPRSASMTSAFLLTLLLSRAAAGSSGEGALRLLLDALKLATPALANAGLHPTGR